MDQNQPAQFVHPGQPAVGPAPPSDNTSEHHIFGILKSRFTLRTSLFVALLIVLMVFIMMSVFVISERRKISNDIAKTGSIFAQLSSDPLYRYYLNDYKDATFDSTFKPEVKNILDKDTDVTSFMLAGVNGQILFDSSELKSSKSLDDKTRTLSDSGTLNMLSSDKLVHRETTVPGEGRVMEIIDPISESTGGHYVSARYLVSFASLTQRTNEIYRQVLMTTIPLLLIGVALAIAFSVSITKPILRLTAATKFLRKGNYDIKVKENSKDEIGELASSFNSMISDIKLSRQKIEQQNLALIHEQVRLKASIESLNVGFIMTDANNNIITINRVANTILCYAMTPQGTTKIDTSIHKWTTDLIHDKLSKSIDFKASINKTLSTGQPIQLKEMGYNGRILRLYMAPVLEMGANREIDKLGTVIVLEDITEAKILERSKDEFFSIASHELRTPLTAIRGNTSLIQTYYSNILKDKDLAEMINDIHDSSIRLIAIVSDFLDASRLEQGKMQYNFESFAIDKVIESIIYELGGLSHSKGIDLRFLDKESFKLHALPEAYGDKNRVKQIVYNLVGNAMNYTEKGSVTIGIQTLPDYLKVVISDTGRGMTPEAQQLLFHKFQQAGSSLFTRDTTRGTGLGLYISRLMVEQMKGHIQIESSTPGKGSVFSFTIPIAKQSDKPIPPTNPTQIPVAS